MNDDNGEKYIRNTFLITLISIVIASCFFKKVLPGENGEAASTGICIILGIMVGFISFCFRMFQFTNRPNKLIKKIRKRNKKRGCRIFFPAYVVKAPVNMAYVVVSGFDDTVEIEDINTNNVCVLENKQIKHAYKKIDHTLKTQNSGVRVGMSVKVAKGVRIGASKPIKEKIVITTKKLYIEYTPSATVKTSTIVLNYGKKKLEVNKFIKRFEKKETIQKSQEYHL